MSVQITFRPISSFPNRRPSYSRKRSPFRATYGSTLQLLESELHHLRATSVVIQADCEATEIRRDGHLRADARLRSPAVILSFCSPKGPLSFPCDTYVDWQDNVRAIALSLQSLRAVDRYGVTRGNEQYKGWAKLPPADEPKTPDVANIVDAVRIIAELAAVDQRTIRDSMDAYRSAYRRAATMTHPDVNHGDSTKFVRVQQAAAILDKWHGV